eukprot:4480066-Amphidinium_carterae.1
MFSRDQHPIPGALLGILDTGCTRTIIGLETLKVLREQLKHRGLQIQSRPETCKFRFGADYSHVSHEKVLVPCSLQDTPCTLVLGAFVVPGGTPLLVSLSVMTSLRASINLGKKEMHVPVLGLNVPLKIQAGHLGVDLWNPSYLQPSLFQSKPHPRQLCS